LILGGEDSLQNFDGTKGDAAEKTIAVKRVAQHAVEPLVEK